MSCVDREAGLSAHSFCFLCPVLIERLASPHRVVLASVCPDLCRSKLIQNTTDRAFSLHRELCASVFAPQVYVFLYILSAAEIHHRPQCRSPLCYSVLGESEHVLRFIVRRSVISALSLRSSVISALSLR